MIVQVWAPEQFRPIIVYEWYVQFLSPGIITFRESCPFFFFTLEQRHREWSWDCVTDWVHNEINNHSTVGENENYGRVETSWKGRATVVSLASLILGSCLTSFLLANWFIGFLLGLCQFKLVFCYNQAISHQYRHVTQTKGLKMNSCRTAVHSQSSQQHYLKTILNNV